MYRPGREDGPCICPAEHRLEVLQVDVAEVVQPEVVQRRGGRREIVLSEPGVGRLHRVRQPGQNPPGGQQILLVDCLNIFSANLSIEVSGATVGFSNP